MMPPKPSKAVIIATIKNVTDQRNIDVSLNDEEFSIII